METKPKSFFDAIGNFPHNVGIYLTYTLDAKVINKLTEHSTGTIVILHDYRQGESLSYNRNSSIITLPVITRKNSNQNCFHSKLVVLKNNNQAKIIIGSANLTRTSFCLPEKEIAAEVIINFDDGDGIEFYNCVLDYLVYLEDLLVIKNIAYQSSLKKLKVNTSKIASNDTVKFIFNNSDASIATQIYSFLGKNKITKKAEKVLIATPFVSENYPLIQGLKDWSDDIFIYLRKGSKIPTAFKDFRIFTASDKGKRKLFHSKLVILQYSHYSIVFVGSSNFSDQGFYRTPNQFSNQENGIIFKTSKTAFDKWFDIKHWEEVIDLADYKEAEQNFVENTEYPTVYGWAENIDSKIIVYLFNPGEERVYDSKNKLIELEKLNDHFYKTEKLKPTIESDLQVIKFRVGKKELVISVFSIIDFEKVSQKNEGLFSPFKGIYSTNPKEMDEEIDKEKITIPTESKIKISEPPKLEQYFFNVKNHIRHISSRKNFTTSNLEEVQQRLNESNDIRLLYLALQLSKVFKTRPNAGDLFVASDKRIDDLADSYNIEKKKLKLFLEKWRNLKS